jgi:hypothetical protein
MSKAMYYMEFNLPYFNAVFFLPFILCFNYSYFNGSRAGTFKVSTTIFVHESRVVTKFRVTKLCRSIVSQNFEVTLHDRGKLALQY